MSKENIDLLYVTTPEAICYLHGYYACWYKANGPMRYPQFYGTAVHVDHDRFIHFDYPTEIPQLARTSISTDNRYFSARDCKPALEFLIKELQQEGWLKGTVGLEFWSYLPNRAISELMERAFREKGCDVIDGSRIMREVRRIKSPQEIKYIEEGVRIADIGHRTIQEKLRPGVTELEMLGEAMRAMMTAGGEIPSLIMLVKSLPVVDGVSLGVGHDMATRKKIKKDELFHVDFCGVVNRYHGNVCRAYYIGGNPPNNMVDRYKKAGGAFEVIRTKIKAGMTVGEFQEILIKYFKKVELWKLDGWALGYELGLSLPPDWVGEFFFTLRDENYLDRVFEKNMVTNFESCFNTALVDTVVYEKSRSRTLSQMPEELIVVD
jgi:Xaa-Pro aminopeptidase